MKNASAHVKKMSAVLKKARAAHKSVEPYPAVDAVTQMVHAFLRWNASRKSADAAVGRLMAELVDINDLRVSHLAEVVRLLGERYPRVEERVLRMHDALQEVFIREHAVTLEPLAAKGKKEQRAYLDTLPGMTPYVSASVMLLSFGVGCVPVDDHLLALLKQEEAVDPDATVEDAEGFIEKQTKSDEALATHLALQAWADETPAPKKQPAKAARPAREKRPTKKPAAHK